MSSQPAGRPLRSPGSNQNLTQQASGSADRVSGASSVPSLFFFFLSTLVVGFSLIS